MADDQEEIKITDTSHGHKKKKKNKKKKRKSAVVATDVVMDESCGENFPSQVVQEKISLQILLIIYQQRLRSKQQGHVQILPYS